MHVQMNAQMTVGNRSPKETSVGPTEYPMLYTFNHHAQKLPSYRTCHICRADALEEAVWTQIRPVQSMG